MPNCGSQAANCDLPIRFDTYSGCSHGCRYCFTQRNYDIKRIETKQGRSALQAFINGKRTSETNWCDWDIPLHWGGLSDPFQPIERERGVSLECLRLFYETQYPFVISTKGKLVLDDTYFKYITEGNSVLQVSLVSPQYDKLEKGAPSFEERMRMVEAFGKSGIKRVLIRIQPYLPDVLEDVLRQLPRYKDAGVYGVIIEGMKFANTKPGLVRLAGDTVFPVSLLEPQYKMIRSKAHEVGLKFFSGERRTRNMGDSLTCCGVGDLPGFKANTANLNHFYFGEGELRYTPAMEKPRTARCFRALGQESSEGSHIDNMSFKDAMNLLCKDRNQRESLGVKYG